MASLKTLKLEVNEPVSWIEFQAKGSVSDTNDVFTAVGDHQIVCKRGVKIPLPQRFVDTIANAKAPLYDHDEAGKRKFMGWQQRFPHSVLGPATLQDFHNFIDAKIGD